MDRLHDHTGGDRVRVVTTHYGPVAHWSDDDRPVPYGVAGVTLCGLAFGPGEINDSVEASGCETCAAAVRQQSLFGEAS